MPAILTLVTTYQLDDEEMDAIRESLPNASILPYRNDDQLAQDIARADVVIGGPLDDELLTAATSLRWHHVPWAGVERVQWETYRTREILLTNASGTNAIPIAEHIIAMMLAFGRAIPTHVRSNERKAWRDWDDRPPTFELTGATVVMLGTGEIGRATAARLRPFGCRLIGVRRSAGPVDGFDEVVAFDRLTEVLERADHVVSSLPMTAGTTHLVSADVLAACKPGAYFYNVGRGGTVDQAALIDALRSGRLAGAGLDVTSPEPLPDNDPLWDAPNVLITGHTAGGSPLTRHRSAALLRDAIARYERGDRIPTTIDLEHGY